jgi:hypothetical protein
MYPIRASAGLSRFPAVYELMKKLFIQFSFYTIMIWMALSDIVIAAPNENFLQDDKFKGAWFTINVPKSFIVKPSLKSATTKNKEYKPSLHRFGAMIFNLFVRFSYFFEIFNFKYYL